MKLPFFNKRPKSIHELWAEINAHPDFAGGAVFDRNDVAAALYMDDDDFPFEAMPAELIARVTVEDMNLASNAIEHWIFDRDYGWRDAITDTQEWERLEEQHAAQG